MSNILIFSDIVDEILSNPNQRFALFGKPSQVATPENTYDLYYDVRETISFSEHPKVPKSTQGLFDFIGNTHFEKYAKEPDLVIPVLPSSASDLKPEMYSLHSHHSRFTTFGTREARELTRTFQGKQSLVSGLNLNFYEFKKTELGTEISIVPEYTLTTEEECSRLIPDWQNLKAFLKQERERISSFYI